MMVIYESVQTYKRVGIMEEKPLDEPNRVAEYMDGAFDDAPMQEQVWVIMLNTKLYPIAREKVSTGLAASCLLDATIVFRPAIIAGASGIILSHNHPSGDPTPSSADLNITKQLVQAGNVLKMPVRDHVIIGHGKHYSFSDRGLLNIK
jgi:DNA repair protein RadC